ncbi:alpha/beta hydrolase [Nocardia sp. NPDC046763]|uniref:alpha/beta hydrolase n=1 Tax=Nocardia sp. NPDC046763 TaxID=3155256 RepID=UPI0033FFDDE6
MKQTHVVLIHGAWFHMSSLQGWAQRFASHGFAVRIPGWPGESDTAAQARFAEGTFEDLGLAALSSHYEKIVLSYDNPPVLIGHSAGGLIAQQLLGAGLGCAAVAVAPLPVDGVPLSDASFQPGAGHLESGQLSRADFRDVVANAVGETEAEQLFERYAAPAPLGLLADLGFARLDIGSVGTIVNTANPARGPLLLISGQEDRMVSDAVTRSVYKLYGDSPAVTDLKQFADRGHSLVFDSGWRSVADHVLTWLAANGIAAMTTAD